MRSQITTTENLDLYERAFQDGWRAKSMHDSSRNPFLAAFTRATREKLPPLEEFAREDHEDALRDQYREEDEITREIIREDAEHAMRYPDIAAAARRLAPTMTLMFTLVAPEDLVDEIHTEFEELFSDAGFPHCSGRTLAQAIAGLLLEEVR